MTTDKILKPLTNDDFVKHDVNLYILDITGEQKQKILENQKLRERIEYYAEHPMAMNYLSFEAWINDLLREAEDSITKC